MLAPAATALAAQSHQFWQKANHVTKQAHNHKTTPQSVGHKKWVVLASAKFYDRHIQVSQFKPMGWEQTCVTSKWQDGQWALVCVWRL
jgi:hypothetical protein